MNNALLSHPISRLFGDIRVPGDKSISHRALIAGAYAVGKTQVFGLLEGRDVLATAEAMRALGARVWRDEKGIWLIQGRGVGGLTEPSDVIDMENSGTGARLAMGLAGAHPFTTFFQGDASLSSRPMERVMAPLRLMGARFTAHSGGRLPLAVRGSERLTPIEYNSPFSSAQVKSAVLLAGLAAPGRTTLIEPQPSRDHTELILRHFGADVLAEDLPNGARAVTLAGQPELEARTVSVPGDISSAAFPLAAAAIRPGSEVTVRNIGLNPLRTGLLETLAEMGAAIEETNRRKDAGELVADLTVKGGDLRGIDVPPERAPAMIDEFPILAVVAACAEGTTRMNGLAELRVKECDRLSVMARGLAACGVKVEEGRDWMAVHGAGASPPGGAEIAAFFDHRIAMSFLVLGTASAQPVGIDSAASIGTSFPGFVALMTKLGAKISSGDPA